VKQHLAAAAALAIGVFVSGAAQAGRVCAYESGSSGWFQAWYCDNHGNVYYSCGESFGDPRTPAFGQYRGDYLAAFRAQTNVAIGTAGYWGNTYLCGYIFEDNN
jgi:hypothetical protein